MYFKTGDFSNILGTKLLFDWHYYLAFVKVNPVTNRFGWFIFIHWYEVNDKWLWHKNLPAIMEWLISILFVRVDQPHCSHPWCSSNFCAKKETVASAMDHRFWLPANWAFERWRWASVEANLQPNPPVKSIQLWHVNIVDEYGTCDPAGLKSRARNLTTLEDSREEEPGEFGCVDEATELLGFLAKEWEWSLLIPKMGCPPAAVAAIRLLLIPMTVGRSVAAADCLWFVRRRLAIQIAVGRGVVVTIILLFIQQSRHVGGAQRTAARSPQRELPELAGKWGWGVNVSVEGIILR
jgi:hypothetical protein